MNWMRNWWQLFTAASTWWKRLAVVIVTAVVLWLMAVVAVNVAVVVVAAARELVPAMANYASRIARWFGDVLPLLVLMVLLTHLMGKPGQTIRKGAVEAVNNVIVGIFALMGVKVTEGKKKKRREDDDG